MKRKKKQSLLTELWRTRLVRIWATGTIGLLLLGVIVAALIVRPVKKETASIPQALVQVATFTPYFYPDAIPGGFEVAKGSVSLTRDVLYIRMTNDKNQGITMTQQALPADLLQSSLGGEKVEGARGTAVISGNQGRTTATLLTEDNKTMVLVDTTDQIDQATIKELLRALRPLR